MRGVKKNSDLAILIFIFQPVRALSKRLRPFDMNLNKTEESPSAYDDDDGDHIAIHNHDHHDDHHPGRAFLHLLW